MVNVSTEPQLQAAVSSLTSDTTIMIAPGTYQLTGTLHVHGVLQNVAIRGASGNRDDVVLVGRGMTNANHGGVPSGIWTGNGVRNITIANLTVRDVYTHCLILNAGTQAPRLYNVRFMNAGEQIVKGNPDGAGGGVDDGVVEYSVFEFSTTSRDWYTNGVDILTGRRWKIRHNLFRNIRAPGSAGRSGRIDVAECRRHDHRGEHVHRLSVGDRHGLDAVNGNDHAGGIIRNNFVYRRAGQAGDAGSSSLPHRTRSSPTTRSSSGEPIRMRSVQVCGVDERVDLEQPDRFGHRSAGGATGTVANNYTQATAVMFVAADSGDLHLVPTATAAINAGTAMSAVTVDWDGQPRPSGAQPDLGADEYSAATPLPAPQNLRIVR